MTAPRPTRRWILSAAFCCSVACLAPVLPAAAPDTPAHPVVLELAIDREIEPVLATYVDEGLKDAERRQASLVLITMDTPGGLGDSMKEIIQHILTSRVPVAVYVTPTGARGASAGFFILLAADVAAMAPGTHAGAASPVLAIGGWTIGIDETLKRKIVNDAMAFLRSYTEKRGRNPELAEKAVTDARAFTDQEALDGKLVDLVAASPEELLRKLDGRELTRFDGTKTTLSLANSVRASFELSARQRLLARIVEPDLFFLLLIVGVLGLYAEFTHPGMVAPGAIGAICAVLALYAMHLLPVNVAGLALIALAIALFVLEAKYTSHGVLAAGGVVSMLLGALFLIRSPLTSGGVSLGIALGVTLPFAGITVYLMRLVLRSRRWKPSTGPEELVGTEGVVVAPVSGQAEGMIRIHGELWRAFSDQPAGAGETVRIVRVDGLKLHVQPVGPATSSK